MCGNAVDPLKYHMLRRQKTIMTSLLALLPSRSLLGLYCFLLQGNIKLSHQVMLVHLVLRIFQTCLALQVKTCGFPPLEDREKPVSTFAGVDFFGGGSLSKEETLRLAELERGAVNDMFVILSDIWLDNEETMEKFETILGGYESENVFPSLFVSWETSVLIHVILLSILTQASGSLNVLPRCPLPKYITEELQTHIPNAVFLSNPCRIKYYTQEIVFFHHDMLYRMRRTCLMPPSIEETTCCYHHTSKTFVPSAFERTTNHLLKAPLDSLRVVEARLETMKLKMIDVIRPTKYTN